ncbi:GlxA family transcriptional regulator [Pseudorhodobacter turbinis]|uniref:GlxA family transcriptional regulator n=1 Tax=Pseudorhodobacter turbinis TaxID=2500533 RepID=A0A4P8EG32_9RHOB|nr:GlxA family transcriptional regulator [Pseudorhodobacter turbinis]QCO55465.1 GlxA family transcriptional regulator [Pseudorhodobacter turbinis]
MEVEMESHTHPWHCLFVLIPRFNMMTLTALLEPLRIANYLSHEQIYSHEFCSINDETVSASNGMRQICQPLPETVKRNTTIFLLASWGGEAYANPKLLAWLRLQKRNGVQICGVEIGTYILARAGLLNHHTATTHWSYLQGFQEKFPEVKAVEQLYTEMGQIMTCAGGTAGFDLMLSFISRYRSQTLAGEIADQIMHHPLRPAAAPQRVTHGRGVDSLPLGVREAVRIIERNIEDPLRVADIAKKVGISQRQLERRFVANFNCSVARFGQLMRLQRARVLLVSTDLSISEISTASGFNTQSHFNLVFKKCFGRKPRHYRMAWPDSETAPKWPGTLSSFLNSVRKTSDKKDKCVTVDPDRP